MNHRLLAGVGFAAFIVATHPANSFPIVVDDFKGGPHILFQIAAPPTPIPGSIGQAFPYANAIGGERDVQLSWSSQGTFLAGFFNGNGSYGSFFGTGGTVVTWDGVDGDAATDGLGLGGFDFVRECANPVLHVTAFADLPNASLKVVLATTTADTATYEIPLTQVGATADYFVPLGVPTAITGSPDLANVNSVTLVIDGTGFPDLDIRVSRLEVICPGDPRTIGYWGNKNGEKTIADLIAEGVDVWAELNACQLRNASGQLVTFSNFAQFKTWLRAATATNMANMLSAQLAGMKLNVLAGFVLPANTLTGPGFPDASVSETIAVGDLLTEAAAALATDGYVPSGDPNRPYFEYLKNVLDAGNNGGGGFGGYDYDHTP